MIFAGLAGAAGVILAFFTMRRGPSTEQIVRDRATQMLRNFSFFHTVHRQEHRQQALTKEEFLKRFADGYVEPYRTQEHNRFEYPVVTAPLLIGRPTPLAAYHPDEVTHFYLLADKSIVEVRTVVRSVEE